MNRILWLLAGLLFFNGLSAQWNMDNSVNLELAALPTADMQSTTTSDGKTWIAFYHQNAGNYDMRAQLLDANGNKLLGPNGVLVSNQTSGTATFVFNICKDASENLVIAFQDQRTGSAYSAVAYKISQAGVQLWGSNGIVLGEGLAPYPGLLSNGEIVIAWNESTNNTLAMQKITTAGALAWGSPVIVRVGTTNTTRGQVVPNLNGNFNLILQKRGTGISTTLYSQRFDNNGSPVWAAPVQLGTETTSGARYYSVTSENDTTYCGYYSSPGSRFNSYLQRVNPDGTLPYGINGSVFCTSTAGSDPYQQTTNIVLKPGSPYVWSLCSFSNTLQNQYGVYVQKYQKSDGARTFGNSALNVYPISTNFDTQAGTVSLVNDGPVFMTYDVNYKIYATRLNSTGGFVWPGNNVLMSATTAGGSTPKGRFGFTGLSDKQAIAVWYENRGEYRGYAQNITPGGLFGVRVNTQGAVPPQINTAGGTLQMVATVYPSTASQSVAWSIVPVTGGATINASGLITASANGTVWAKAIPVQDGTVADSMLITISNQSGGVAVTGVTVSTQGGVPAVINTNGGTLQMVATITPANATNQAVTWAIVPVTGTATISAAGLVTAVTNGTVWARAISQSNPLAKDSMLITISNQFIQVTGLVVSTQGGVPAVINTNGGTLQMVATITPANATNPAVTWAIVPVTGTATINASGLVTAVTNGTVWARAISQSNSTVKDSMLITISNQFVQVTGLVVSTQGGVPATITTNAGTLQMVATITPANATNPAVTWAIVPVTGTATINASGLVTAVTNGTVWARAISQSNPLVKDSMLITISNQFVQVTGLVVSTQGGVPATITTNAGTLQMVATITPANATNQAVTWAIVPVTGSATISASGLVTAITNGTVWARAISQSNTAVKDSMLITISNQFIPVTGLIVSTQGGVPATITVNAGTLQMIATITPANATNPAVTWAIVPVTGSATISASGLVTAVTNGTVWARAISQSNTAVKDSMLITITNQFIPVTSIQVRTVGLVPAVITTNGGTLPLQAIITPANATNPAVTWSITPGTGTASISAAGVVTAISNGTVWGKAVSVSNPALKDSILITISNQGGAANGKMLVYPVPNRGKLFVKAGEDHPAFTLEIFDGSGKKVYQRAIAANALRSAVSFDLNFLPGGFYTIRFTGSSYKEVKWIRE